jgi:hypothetical protein
MFKFLISLVVLIVIAGGLWWSGLLSQWVPQVPTFASLMGNQTATTTQQTPTTTQQQQQTPPHDLPTAANDASDQALVKDSAALDAELTALSTDNANAQGSLNDKPVTQEY